MKKILFTISASLILFLGLTAFANAQLRVLRGLEGGTNTSSTSAGNIGSCLSVASVNPLVWTLGACSGGGGGGAGSVTTSTPITAFTFPFWQNTTGGLNGSSSVWYSAGSIGINTQAPSSSLHVVGNFRVSATSTFDQLTASRAVATDGSSNLVSSAVTGTELSYLSGVTSAVQTQLSARALTATTITAGTGLTGGGDLSTNRTIALTVPVAIVNGGTATTTTPADLQVLTGNNTNYSLLKLTGSTNLTVTTSTSAITFTPTGLALNSVTISAGGLLTGGGDLTSNRTISFASSSLSLGTMSIINSPVPIANGGLATSTVPTDAQFLVGQGSIYKLLTGSAGTGLTFATTTTGFSYALTTPVTFGNGGTGLSSAADDTTMISSGSAWQAKAIPDCTDSSGNHINYTVSSNSWSCGTSSTGSGTLTGNSTSTYVAVYQTATGLIGDPTFTYTSSTKVVALGNGASGNSTIKFDDTGTTKYSIGLDYNNASVWSLSASSTLGTNNILMASSTWLAVGTSTVPGANAMLYLTGHEEYGGATPTVSSCGTNPTIVGNDNTGIITTSGTVNSCTLTFAKTWTNSAICIEADDSTALTADVSSISSSSVTFGFSASLGTGHIYYHCNSYK